MLREQDTGGVPLSLISLSANGMGIYATKSGTTFTHCSLQASTAYTYSLEVRNANGLSARAAATFQTTNLSAPELLTMSDPVALASSAIVPVDMSCDTGGSKSLVYKLYSSEELELKSGLFSCCQLYLSDLQPSTNYMVSVQAASGGGDVVNRSFTTLSGIPSTAGTQLAFASDSELELTLIPPADAGGSAVQIEVLVESAAAGMLVYHDTVECALVGITVACPDTLRIADLTSTENDTNFTVASRAVGAYGSSSWTNETYSIDSGQSGVVGFVRSEYGGSEGTSVSLEVSRLYGTSNTDSVDFQVVGDRNWSCSPSDIGAMCTIATGGNNSGELALSAVLM